MMQDFSATSGQVPLLKNTNSSVIDQQSGGHPQQTAGEWGNRCLADELIGGTTTSFLISQLEMDYPLVI